MRMSETVDILDTPTTAPAVTSQPRDLKRNLPTATFESNMYTSLKDQPEIQTISTRAVLVVRGELPSSTVSTITRAIFEGEAYLQIEGGTDTMTHDLPSLPLHAGATAYYKDAGFLPGDPPLMTLDDTWRILAILVILVGAYKGYVELRRIRAAKLCARQILSVSLVADDPESVGQLITIRRDIQQAVRKRWWEPTELDKRRWSDLRDLIDDQITIAKDNLTRALVEEIYTLCEDRQTGKVSQWQHFRPVIGRITQSFRLGELDADQRSMLMSLIDESTEKTST